MARQNCSKNLNAAGASPPMLRLTQNTKTSEKVLQHYHRWQGRLRGDRYDPLPSYYKIQRKIICMADMMAH
jgi:hypothetical protein